jgi:hypothetical protein
VVTAEVVAAGRDVEKAVVCDTSVVLKDTEVLSETSASISSDGLSDKSEPHEIKSDIGAIKTKRTASILTIVFFINPPNYLPEYSRSGFL